MSSRRGYRRRDYVPRGYISKASKYQFVPFTINFKIPANSSGMSSILVPTSSVAGIRKVKNFNINLVTSCPAPLIFAVVYIPEGGNISSILPNINNAPQTELFSELFAANQWVIGCGSIISGSLNNWKTRMSRNLNNGDSVYLYVYTHDKENIGAPAEGDTYEVCATGNYAIRYN